jgi:hypothetical protein
MSKKPPHWAERAVVRVMVLITQAVLLLTVGPAALVEAVAADLEPPSPSLSEAGPQRVGLQVLPGVYQPGARVSSSHGALSVLNVAVRPAVAGRRIVLQHQVGEKWRRTGTAVTNENGQATIFVPPRLGSSYRAVAKSYRGLGPARSASVPADVWGDPDFVDEFDATTLSLAWEHRIQFYNPWGGRSCSKGSPAAVRVSNGVLRLSSMVDPAATGGPTYAIARNLINIGDDEDQEYSEFTGPTFSTDGKVLYVNIQDPGLTFAITGPWDKYLG